MALKHVHLYHQGYTRQMALIYRTCSDLLSLDLDLWPFFSCALASPSNDDFFLSTASAAVPCGRTVTAGTGSMARSMGN